MGTHGSAPRLGSLAERREPGLLRVGARERSSIQLPGGADLISASIPAKQQRLSSNSGLIPSHRRRIGPRCFVALGKYKH